MERTRKRTQLNVDIECAEYVRDAAERATRAFSTPQTSTPSATTISTTETTEVESAVTTAETTLATGTTIDDVKNPAPLIPRMFKGVNVVELFTLFRRISAFLIVVKSNLENIASTRI